MAPELSRIIRRATLGLLVLAAAATEISAAETRPVLFSLGTAALWIGIALILSRFARPPKDGQRVPPRYVALVLLLFAVVPFVVEPLRRRWIGDGYPLELQMVFALRNLGLGLAAFAIWPLCLHLACVVSLFLILFAVSLSDHPAVLCLLGLYTAAGSVWLMLVYWKGLRRFFALADSASLEVQLAAQRFPWFATFVCVGLVSSVLALLVVGPQRAAGVLAEWLPTSGGTGNFDPYARGGINDGDDEVKGNNPRSTGTVETEQFLDSPLPSLYDVANDMYGEPFKVKEQERAIPLDGQTKVWETKKPPPDNQRPNREFPTARQGPKHPRDSSSRAARALFEVEGRTPLHIRVAAFDTFDGVSWQPAPVNLCTCLLDKERDSRWMIVRGRAPMPIFAEIEGHKFKITTPFGWLVPTPPHLIRFRVGRVDQATFFAWGPDGILRMAQRKTPSGIVVETQSRTVDPRQLASVAFLSWNSHGRPRYATVPASLHPEVAALALHWAHGHAPGWPQIAAVVESLRSEYLHDPSAHTPEGSADPLADFLLHARRGPDYQFASAAAVLLRVLGYATRLMSGFYASPEHYDPVTRHTPVVKEDLHFWAEVLLPTGEWLVIEPTPGYEVLKPNLPLAERVLAALVAAGSWLGEHIVAVSLCCIGVAVSWWKRCQLLDAGAVTFLRLCPSRTWRDCVRRAVWLLEWRGGWVGRPRMTSQTQAQWLRILLAAEMDKPEALGPLALMAEWSSYAPDLEPPWGVAEVQTICRRALAAWTVQRLRRNFSARAVRRESL